MKKLAKISIQRLAAAVSFLCVFALLLTLASNVLYPKDNSREMGLHHPYTWGFYGEPKNSLDVIAIGNSDLYSAVSPMQMWKAHGFTSYVCGEPAIKILHALNILQKVLACQSPQLVILETDCLYAPSVRLENALDLFMRNAFPVVEYHDRWKELSWQDFVRMPQYTQRVESKGFVISQEVKRLTYAADYMNTRTARDGLRRSTLLYLDRFVALCRERGIQLLFVQVPSANSWNQARHDAVLRYAQRNAIPFIDYNLLGKQLGFDWNTDSRDGGNHLNYSGAKKVTQHLGQYLAQQYRLTDHRGDSAYAQWDADYKAYAEQVKKTARKGDRPGEAISPLPTPDHSKGKGARSRHGTALPLQAGRNRV